MINEHLSNFSSCFSDKALTEVVDTLVGFDATTLWNGMPPSTHCCLYRTEVDAVWTHRLAFSSMLAGLEKSQTVKLWWPTFWPTVFDVTGGLSGGCSVAKSTITTDSRTNDHALSSRGKRKVKWMAGLGLALDHSEASHSALRPCLNWKIQLNLSVLNQLKEWAMQKDK